MRPFEPGDIVIITVSGNLAPPPPRWEEGAPEQMIGIIDQLNWRGAFVLCNDIRYFLFYSEFRHYDMQEDPTMEVQRFLRGGNTLDDLLRQYAVSATRHKEYNNLVLLKYNQINSPFNQRIVQECRGLILDESNNWSVVSRSFDKFFNLGESNQATIDWDSAHIYEKIDGSICTLFFYDNQWHVATSGSPDASGQVNGHSMTFAELFRAAWRNCTGAQPGHLFDSLIYFTDMNFIFELTSPFNRVVVNYPETSIRLIGIRNRVTGHEESLQSAKQLGITVPIVKSFDFQKDGASLAKIADSLNPVDQEGFVVVDKYFNRIKIKGAAYVALHHLRGNGTPTPKNILELCLSGEHFEISKAFPEYKNIIDEQLVRIENFVITVQNEFKALKSHMAAFEHAAQAGGVQITPVRHKKEYASLAVHMKCPDLMFKSYGMSDSMHLADPLIYLKDVPLDRAVSILELK